MQRGGDVNILPSHKWRGIHHGAKYATVTYGVSASKVLLAPITKARGPVVNTAGSDRVLMLRKILAFGSDGRVVGPQNTRLVTEERLASRGRRTHPTN